MTSSSVLALATALLLRPPPGNVTTTSAPATQPSPPRPMVRLIAFITHDCGACRAVTKSALEALGERHGAGVEVRHLGVDEGNNLDVLLAYEKHLGSAGGPVPVVVIGRRILHGPREIEANLERLVRQAARDGGVDFTELPAALRPPPLKGPPRPQHPVYVAYFYQPGCSRCRRLDYVLSRLHARYPGVVLKEFDLNDPDNRLLLEALGRRARAPGRRRNVPGTVFVSGRPFVGGQATYEALEAAVLKAATEDRQTAPPWDLDEAELVAASTGILDRFREMSVWTVALAGLIDGVNPCAFATIVFLVAYLTAVGKQRREVLAYGATFTLGVFATYLGVGIGLKVLLQATTALEGPRPWLYRGAAAFCLSVGFLSLADYRRARRKGLKEMKLVLPTRWRVYTRSLIARSAGAKLLLPVSIALGAAISLVELACTGQVYLPTILYVIGASPNTRAYALLVLYNIVFILPLVAVFSLVGLGLSSRRLAEFSKRHLSKAKLALAGVLLLLGTGLLALSAT